MNIQLSVSLHEFSSYTCGYIQDQASASRIGAMIAATKTHTLPSVDGSSAAPDHLEGAGAGDLALFLDMDLSVLGAHPLGAYAVWPDCSS